MTLTQTSFRGVDGAHHHLSGLPYGGDICPQYSVQSTELQRSEEMTVGFPASQWHFKVIHKLLVPIESQRIAMGRPLHDPLLGPVKVSPVIKFYQRGAFRIVPVSLPVLHSRIRARWLAPCPLLVVYPGCRRFSSN